MSHIINLNTFKDERGALTVIEKILPFEIKRVYYLYDIKADRGGHRHKKTIQALIALSGSCEIFIDNGMKKNTTLLDSPEKCLIVEPEDWHTMDKFSKGSILLVLSSELYMEEDYITKRY